MSTTTDTITQIAIDQLHASPFNPRKTFTGIAELVDSIKAEGRIHSPLLVRPITPNPLRDDIVTGYEVVFGHRRLRAADVAGLATVPCMVRAMTNAEARSAQIAENMSRADVHPIEEAEGFALMIEQDGITADDLVASTGKSRSYVYGRLKLLQACAEIRAACIAGEVGSEVALLIARLRTDKLQQKALAAIRNDTSQHSKLVDGVRCRDEYSLSRKPGPLMALAQHYGVDAEHVMRASAPRRPQRPRALLPLQRLAQAPRRQAPRRARRRQSQPRAPWPTVAPTR